MHVITYLMLFRIASFGLGLIARNRNMEISFVLDFMETQASPNIVIEHLCWSRDDKQKLAKGLTKQKHRYRSFSNDHNIFDDFYHSYYYTIVTNVKCNFEMFLNRALQTTLIKHPNVWIVLGGLDIIKQNDYYIPLNSLFIFPIVANYENNIVLKNIYKINKHNYGYIEKVIGVWSRQLRVHNLKMINIVKDRSNFMSMPLRVSYIVTNNSTLEHFMDYRDQHVDNLTKINYALYNFICDLLNATQVRLITNGWGFETNSKETIFSKGMFEDLVYDRSDIAGTVSFTPANRLKYFKYIFAPIKDFSVYFVFRAPSLAYYTNLFVLPFDKLVWFTIGFLLIFCSVIINTIFKWETKQEAFLHSDNKENTPNVLDVIMMQVAIMCQIDFFYEPRSVSGKIATFFVLISFTFIYTAYSARIVLLLQSNTNKINDLDSLYGANFDFGVENQLYNIYYFKGPSDRANEYWRKLIYENKIKKPNGEKFLAARDGMILVRDTNFAFHIDQTVANYLIDRTFSNSQKCSLRFVETIFKSDIPHLSVPRNSTYIEFFATSFKRLAETGLHNREYRRWFTKKPSCEGSDNIFVSVGLTETYFLFAVFGSGICLSIVLLVLEKCSYTYLKIGQAL